MSGCWLNWKRRAPLFLNSTTATLLPRCTSTGVPPRPVPSPGCGALIRFQRNGGWLSSALGISYERRVGKQ